MKARRTAILILFIVTQVTFFLTSNTHALEKGRNSASIHRGPLNLSNPFPPTLMFLNYRPLKAENLRKGEYRFLFDIDESNTIVVDQNPGRVAEAIIDSELTQYRFDLSRGFTKRLELGLSAAILHYHGPFMDCFIESVEDIIGLPSGTRLRRPRDDFRFYLVHDNGVMLDLNNGTAGIGDLVLRAKYALMKEKSLRAMDITTRFELKLPTGAVNKGMGSGSIDYGVALLVHKSLGNFHIQGDLAYQILGELNLGGGYDPENVLTGVISAEYSWRRISGIFQFVSTQTALRNIGIPRLEEGGDALILGLKWDIMKNMTFQFSMTENISDVTFSDFSMNAGLEFRFGKKEGSRGEKKRKKLKRRKISGF